MGRGAGAASAVEPCDPMPPDCYFCTYWQARPPELAHHCLLLAPCPPPLLPLLSSPPCRYEKLQRWDDALKAYRLKLESAPPGSVAHVEALLGQCRCLAALAEWDKLFAVCRGEWARVEPHVRREMAPIAAHAAWQLSDWQAMRQYVDVVAHGHGGGAEGAFLSAVINIKNMDYSAAAGGVSLGCF